MGSMKTNVRMDRMLGQAGVAKIACDLMLRSIPAWQPLVDYGSDLMLPNGWKLQVKTSRLHTNVAGLQLYTFATNNGKVRREFDEPDYHVLVGWDEKRTWIVPSSLVMNRPTVAIVSKLGPRSQDRYGQWEDRWALLEHAKVEVGKNVLGGAAGNLRVAAELLGMGQEVSLPMVDNGTDILTVEGIRIQVKASRLYSKPNKNESPTFTFHLNNARTRDLSKSRQVKYSETVDIFVLWGIDHDRFWIVPAAEVDFMDTVTTGIDAKWVDGEEIRKLKESGKNYREIGEELGIAQMTAWRKVNKDQDGKGAVTAKLRQYEGNWDLICAHAGMMAEEAVDAPVARQ